MATEPRFAWDEENGVAMCILRNHDEAYFGMATCAPEDADMKSEKTGCEIAERRAAIFALRGRRDKLKTELAGLNKYYHTMILSKNFDKSSYPIKRLYQHMQLLEEDIATTKELIVKAQDDLRNYMKQKEEFYKKIRKNRGQE